MNNGGIGGTRATSTPLNVSQLGACKILALGGFGLLLYFAHYAFIPIALALLLALVLSGPVEALYKHGVPRSLSALLRKNVAWPTQSAALPAPMPSGWPWQPLR